ncbi:MAG: hypothetical protein ABI274_13365 [Ktedonobacterales bacterium]
MDEALRAWCEAEGLMRHAVVGEENGAVSELACGPLVALGSSDNDFYAAPNPDDTGYPGKPLGEMALDDYNTFLFRWLEAAVNAGDGRCAHCGKLLYDAEDMPDPDTWDAIFIEKELVAWMLVHFDCKRWLAKKLKGMQPFELTAHPTPHYDLSQLDRAATERPSHAAEDSQIPDATDLA